MHIRVCSSVCRSPCSVEGVCMRMYVSVCAYVSVCVCGYVWVCICDKQSSIYTKVWIIVPHRSRE